VATAATAACLARGVLLPSPSCGCSRRALPEPPAAPAARAAAALAAALNGRSCREHVNGHPCDQSSRPDSPSTYILRIRTLHRPSMYVPSSGLVSAGPCSMCMPVQDTVDWTKVWLAHGFESVSHAFLPVGLARGTCTRCCKEAGRIECDETY
jgi:hypothetical protein